MPQAELSKESIYEQLKILTKELKAFHSTIHLATILISMDQLKAKKGNKYIISMADRDIYCNGETIWNVSKYDKKAIISSYEEDDEDALSIENIFFYFLINTKHQSLRKKIHQKGAATMFYRLYPRAPIVNIRALKLSLFG
jgi:hypothetical protein